VVRGSAVPRCVCVLGGGEADIRCGRRRGGGGGRDWSGRRYGGGGGGAERLRTDGAVRRYGLFMKNQLEEEEEEEEEAARTTGTMSKGNGGLDCRGGLDFCR
jgi:hypothetical protein